MNHNHLEERVNALVAQAASARGTVVALSPEVSLRRDLGLDSLGLATLLFNFGEELGVDPNDLIEIIADNPVNTLADMVALGRRALDAATEGARS
jgi:acyl carrier protein